MPEPAETGLTNYTTQRYVLAGLVFGACFPLAAWVIDVAFRGLGWSWDTVSVIHATNPLHGIVDLAPGVLGAMGYLIGRKQAQIEADNRVLEDRVRERTAQLAANEERFRSLVQHASDVIAVLTADGFIQYVSPSCETVTGKRPEELMGTRVRRLIHRDDLSRAVTFLSEASSRGSGSTPVEFRVRHRDGSWRSLEVLCTNLLDDRNVRGLVLNCRDVTERRGLEAQLAHQAFHDSLTGLANRALFRDRLAHAIERSHRSGLPPSVLFLDLDDFKAVNDSLGHRAGDALLVGVAERLQRCVRAADTVARLGGDEFAILIEDTGPDAEHEVIEVADRALASLRQPFVVEGVEVFVGGSIGISAPGTAGASAEDVLRDADAAMYHAKNRGGGRVERFEPGLHAAALERLALITDLRRAFERNELEVHYQPIMDLNTERIKGVEALARWRHPERGLVSPLTFIPLAEETGLIGQLGVWVLREACHTVRGWQDAQAPGEEPLNLSVNVSARQVQDPLLPKQVSDVLREAGLDPSTLTLEITEGLLLQDGETIQHRLRTLKDLGINLALDDFGTGYSSLSYLQRFPIDVLKIDKSFVDQVTVGAEASALVQTIVSLGETLQMRTVAEGIEQPEQAERLRALGCGGGQGYYFARPLTADRLTELLNGTAEPTSQPRAA